VASFIRPGGLVFRAFLERAPEYLACFEQVLTFGIRGAARSSAARVYAGAPINIGRSHSSRRFEADRSKRAGAYDLFPRCPD